MLRDVLRDKRPPTASPRVMASHLFRCSTKDEEKRERRTGEDCDRGGGGSDFFLGRFSQSSTTSFFSGVGEGERSIMLE